MRNNTTQYSNNMYIIKQLRRKKNLSQSDLAKEIGVSLRTIQLYERKDANIPIKNLTKIADLFDLSIAELYLHELNEMGEPYGKSKPFTKHGSVFYPFEHGKYLVMAPLVLMEHQKDYIERVLAKESERKMFQVGFVVDNLEDEAQIAFEIAGDSMNDTSIASIPNKAIVLGLQCDKEAFKNQDALDRKSAYVLVCRDRIICKQITSINAKKNILLCQNLNKSPEYQDFELPLEDVLQIFKVIKKQL
ncbi:helix-turn-helix domain-containing protein [Flagellimonas hymeniacidonis]|uniref:Helix-turn-helix domain-containing protein n=2 Tax=Flagellimonas hymeniacidonis TaxID=2603628 RepID=A0A5C8V6P1_9FLAO|nr:helix-turn-helix domain-containing protein [Flagellimonas hymeniacidonis]